MSPLNSLTNLLKYTASRPKDAVSPVTDQETRTLQRKEWALMMACAASVALFFLTGLFFQF